MSKKNNFYIQNKEIASQEVGNKSFLFHPDTLEIFELNDTSLFIWNQCKKKTTIKKITTKLGEEYDVSLKQAEKDIFATINVFTKNKLLIIVK